MGITPIAKYILDIFIANFIIDEYYGLKGSIIKKKIILDGDKL